MGYCYESTGNQIAPCFRCGVFTPKGLIVYSSGIYEWCPICSPNIPGYREALDRFDRELWERWQRERAERDAEAAS